MALINTFCCLSLLFCVSWPGVSSASKPALLRVHVKAFHSDTRCSVLSSGDIDDWERPEVRPGHAGVQNVLYLNDEEEEEEEDGEEVEQGQEGRKVTVRSTHKHNTAVLTIAARL